MGALTNAKRAVARMLGKTEKPRSTTTVPMTAKEGIGRILSTEGAIEKTIPLSTEQLRSLTTLCETVASGSQSSVRGVVMLKDYTLTMTITPDHLMFDGSALLVTTNGTQNTGRH